VYQIEDCWYEGRHPLSYEEHQELIKKLLKLLEDYRNQTTTDFSSLDTSNLKLDKLSVAEDALTEFSNSTNKKRLYNLWMCCQKVVFTTLESNISV